MKRSVFSFLCLFLFLLAVSVLGRGGMEGVGINLLKVEGAESGRISGITPTPDNTGEGGTDTGSERVYQPTAREVLMVLTVAYPKRVKDLQFLDGNWSVEVNGTRYFWMNGRMLSDENRKDWSLYSSYYFRPYTGETPPVRRYTLAEEKRIKEWIDKREKKQTGVYPGFMESLWGMESVETAERTVKKMRFFGRNIRVHPLVASQLGEVQKDIVQSVGGDEAVSQWLAGMKYFGGYYWRNIAGSANRSMHSYGLAIDSIAMDYGGRHVYWRWSRDLEEKWWEIAHAMRYEVPLPVIRAFEKNGFIWGGNWVLFDQIHFEYRPELILLGEIVKEKGK